MVGLNAFQAEEKLELERLKVDPAIEAAQRLRLQAIRQRRDSNRASDLLGQLESAARGQDNLVPLFITCVENDITLGEICSVLRGLWGEYQPPAWV